jgi:hypothetical protein
MTAYRIVKAIMVPCGLHGAGGVVVFLGSMSLLLFERVSGVQIFRPTPHQSFSLGGTLWVLGMAVFWLLEAVAAWLIWFRLSKLAIYLAVTVVGLWAVLFIGLVFEVLEIGSTGDYLPILLQLLAAATLCWPCIVMARWLSRAILTPPRLEVAELGAAPSSGPTAPAGKSGVPDGPPSVS